MRETTLFRARLSHIKGHDSPQFGHFSLMSIFTGPQLWSANTLLGCLALHLAMFGSNNTQKEGSRHQNAKIGGRTIQE
jgi:hypothetical protein